MPPILFSHNLYGGVRILSSTQVVKKFEGIAQCLMKAWCQRSMAQWPGLR